MRRSTCLLTLLVAALAGCAERGPDAEPGAQSWSGELPVSAPWLRERLPSGVLAYVRIPHPLGLVAVPKDNTLAPALASEANVRNVLEIQRGLAENVLGSAPLFDDPWLAMLLDDLRSPLEIAVFGLPAPSALVAATLDVGSAAELEASIEALEPIGLAAPLGGDGIAELTGLPVPAFVSFDASSGRLLVSAGPAVTAASLRQALANLPTDFEHPMRAFERRIDASGQGLFAWVDAGTVLPLAPLFAPPEALAALEQTGLDALEAVAVGVGSAGGRGRTSVLLDIGWDAARRPVPVVANTLTATAAGPPDAVLLLSLPSAEEFARLESLAIGAAPDAVDAWQEAKASFAERLGVEIEELLAALGPELHVILDAAGDYGAVRLRDAALFDALVQRVADASAVPLGQHEAAGRTFYEWRPPLGAGAAGDDGEAAGILARMRDRWYWIADGDYVYFAGVPQPLIDRVRAGAETSIGAWLTETQRVDWSSSLLAATASVDKLPRRIYYLYIELMQSLADFAGVEYDVWSMPTADALGLASAGTIGASLETGEPYVSFELTYESQPAELLLGAGGLGTIAAAGVLAAVAIPAYQDYTIRAGVAAGLEQAGAVRAAVSEHHASTGRFPSAEEADALEPEAVAPPVAAIAVEPGTGSVVVYFVPGTVPGGGQIWLMPRAGEDGALTWTCGGSIAAEHLPPACR